MAKNCLTQKLFIYLLFWGLAPKNTIFPRKCQKGGSKNPFLGQKLKNYLIICFFCLVFSPFLIVPWDVCPFCSTFSFIFSPFLSFSLCFFFSLSLSLSLTLSLFLSLCLSLSLSKIYKYTYIYIYIYISLSLSLSLSVSLSLSLSLPPSLSLSPSSLSQTVSQSLNLSLSLFSLSPSLSLLSLSLSSSLSLSLSLFLSLPLSLSLSSLNWIPLSSPACAILLSPSSQSFSRVHPPALIVPPLCASLSRTISLSHSLIKNMYGQ